MLTRCIEKKMVSCSINEEILTTTCAKSELNKLNFNNVNTYS